MTLEQQIKDVVEGVIQQLSGQIRERLQGLVGEVSQAAAAERVSVVRELRMAAEAEIAKRSQEAVASSQADHSRRLEEAVAAARAEGARRIEEAIATAKAEQGRRVEEAVAAARGELTRERETALMSLRAEQGRRIDEAAAAAKAEHARLLDDQVRQHQNVLEERTRQHQTLLDERTRQHQHALDGVRAEKDRAIADAVSRARAEADERMAQAVIATRREAAQVAERSLVDVRAAERHRELEQIDRLADGMRRMDAARSLTDVLEVLVDGASKEAPRVAVLLVRGQKLMGWKAVGFGPEVDPRRIDVPVADAGLLGRALRSSSAIATGETVGAEANATPFGPLTSDCAGIAMPVRVGGEVVAVVYADDACPGARAVPSAWPELVEVLARHAARCLEVLTVTRVAQPQHAAVEASPQATQAAQATTGPQSPRYAPQQVRSQIGMSSDDEDAARRYAKLLVSEIKLYHESALNQGRRDRNISDRLRSEIERARRLYDERVPAAIRSKTDHFGQELVRTLANGDAGLLGSL